ncbi:MAG TPA: serine hydrolase [Ktedonobacterales bacterium]|nr:serine hydrolase [Ktedonobacterales bacterium]
MSTEQPENQENITGATLLAPPDNKPLPRARLVNGRMVMLAVLLVVVIVAGVIFGPGNLVNLSQASSAPLTWKDNQPTQAIAPPCPVLRADPTLGVSLMDVRTGQPICERNPNNIAQPASTTKVMAAILVEQYLQAHHLSLNATITVKSIDTQVESDAAIADLQVGHAYSVRLLLYMVSILSAADAVMALARMVAGTRADFLALMNQHAQALGMQHTHYTSPYGYALVSADNWQDGETTSVGNYSTAHDMATLMLEFAQYPDLVTIFGATEYHEGDTWLYRGPGHTLPDSWIGVQSPDDPSPDPVKNLHLPFQVLAVKKGCMWCTNAIHKLSYVLLARYQQQTIAATFLYTTQDYFNPLVGDMLPTLLWAFNQCSVPAYATYCYPPAPTPTPGPSPTP